MKKVILLSMPFGALERPSLGLSLLKAKLREEDISCDVRYLTFPFADFIGTENYQWLCYELPYTAFAGDWSFTAALYEKECDARQENYVEDVLRRAWNLDENAINRILYIKSHIPVFLEHCVNSIQWENYAIAGFTSTFEQNIASLALAKKIKTLYPQVVTVFGGANWEAAMGLELHRKFPFVDYVCSGEAEETFPALVKNIFAGAPTKETEKISGIVFRQNAVSVATGAPAKPRALDELPYPDYSDFFQNLEHSSASNYIFPTLLFETSRGCWWGAKSHCTFCGLNGSSMVFRSKSPARALDEFEYLTTRWKTESVDVVDNILDMKYFDSVIPALAEARRPVQIFYEVKSNLKREQIKMLRAAGINRIQPGIESLSDHVLKLMRKGTSGLRNLQLLKWAKEFGVTAEWNLLYGFPGETREDYEQILQMLPAVRFLNPPCAVGPIRLDRFSPYFNAPGDYGLVNLRPMLTYHYLYPFDNESLMRIAYYFEFDYESGINPRNYAANVIRYIEEWKQNPEKGALHLFKKDDGAIILVDTRANANAGTFHLDGMEKFVYEYCDEARSLPNILSRLREKFPDTLFSAEQIAKFLESLIVNRLMVTDGAGYLSLAIHAPTVADSEARVSNEVSDEHRPLRSYLPPQMSVRAAKIPLTALKIKGQL